MTLVSIPANPVPDDVVSGTITTPDGVNLRFARWAPPAGRKGTVCLFTGRSEQIEKYFETVQDLRDRGFAVAMVDWRGQGGSARGLSDARKGYVQHFSDFEIDVEAFYRQVVLPDCPPPYFALAHSMGGAVMLRVAHAEYRGTVMHQRDQRAPDRKAGDERFGAVDRIEHPDVIGIFALVAEFLADDAMLRKAGIDHPAHHRLGGAVGFGDGIEVLARAFAGALVVDAERGSEKR